MRHHDAHNPDATSHHEVDKGSTVSNTSFRPNTAAQAADAGNHEVAHTSFRPNGDKPENKGGAGEEDEFEAAGPFEMEDSGADISDSHMSEPGADDRGQNDFPGQLFHAPELVD